MAMNLEVADWPDVIKVLHETYFIWSPGLNKTEYLHYIWRQLQHPWARKHYRFLVCKANESIIASCKLYSIDMLARGHNHRFAGVGAVYTQQACRGLGYGKRLMQAVIALAKAEGYSGLYLFSDIGPDFYGKLGFLELGKQEFWISLPDLESNPHLIESFGGREFLAGAERDVSRLSQADSERINRHYRRWLARQPYGVDRSPLYWSYKFFRESYLHKFSSWKWPGLELVVEVSSEGDYGYALVEHGSATLRVLEVIGSAETQRLLWSKLAALALSRSCRRIRGWESVAPQGIDYLPQDRAWGCPMVLPLSQEINVWPEIKPCRLLELDHL